MRSDEEVAQMEAEATAAVKVQAGTRAWQTRKERNAKLNHPVTLLSVQVRAAACCLLFAASCSLFARCLLLSNPGSACH